MRSKEHSPRPSGDSPFASGQKTKPPGRVILCSLCVLILLTAAPASSGNRGNSKLVVAATAGSTDRGGGDPKGTSHPRSRTALSRSKATLSRSRTLIIAHRGGALEAPENTIDAFTHARRAGADGIETDLRLTLDGKVVLYHDARVGRIEWGQEEPIPDLSGLIERLANLSREQPQSCAGLAEKILISLQKLAGDPEAPLVSDTSYSQLQADRKVDRAGHNDGGHTPTLDEALRAFPTGLIDLDIKPGPRLDQLLDKIIAELRNFPGIDRVVIEPPDLRSAKRLRSALGPKLKLQITPGLWLAEPFEESLEFALKLKPHSISVPSSLVSRELVERAHAAGVEVWAWTVDSPDVARSMELMGVDAIKTDRPAVLITSLDKAVDHEY